MVAGAASLGSKAAQPLVAASFRALRRELARREGDAALRGSAGAIDDALSEALAVLAQQADTIRGSVSVGIKGLIARPAIFRHPVVAAWIASAGAQDALRSAARALLRNQSDDLQADAAKALYKSFLGAEDAPDADEVYASALDFLCRSIARDLTMGDHLLYDAIAGVSEKIDAKAPDTSELVDEHVRLEIGQLRRRRFFGSADTQAKASALGAALIDGRLRGATPAVKAWALAWCSRLISTGDPALAQDFLARAREATGERLDEIVAAEAFLLAAEDHRKALAILDMDASPLQMTVALQILRRALSLEEAETQRLAAGIMFEGLDAEGRFVLLTFMLERGDWESMRDLVRRLGPDDYQQAPALLWFAATALVAAALPADMRPQILYDLPPNPAHFRLPEDAASLAERRLARTLLRSLAAACSDLDLRREAAAAERYGLWLDLRDHDTRSDARETLRAKMDDRSASVGYLPLALAFGLKVDRKEAETAIALRIARGDEAPQLLAAAILALIFDYAGNDLGTAIAYLTQHRAILAEQIEAGSLASLEIRLLADAGRGDEARAKLGALDEDMLPAPQRQLLENMLSADDQRPSITALEMSYAADPHTGLLAQLVHRYGEAGYSDRYFELARAYVLVTRSAADVRDVLRILAAEQRDAEAVLLLEELGPLAKPSDALLAYSAWARFRLGDLAGAEADLAPLEIRRDNEELRALRFQLLIASGRWSELEAFVERQWDRRDKRSAIELVQCANLAVQIGSPRAADLIRLAATREPDNPDVLVTAYTAATEAGLEGELEEASRWLERAYEFSSEDGPIQRATLSDIKDMAPEWNKRVDDAARALASGALPMGAAAAMLRQSWLELQLQPLLENSKLRDHRHRRLVPLYGARRPRELTGGIEEIALDRTAIVTLAALDILDITLESFKRIWIAHDLLQQFFDERRRVRFHQPSRIKFAHQLLALIQSGAVRPFLPTTIADGRLVADIGPDLAALITEASRQPGGQHIVIHPYPITRAGSLLEDPADLEGYSHCLSSCSAVVDALERAGHLTRGEQSHARAFLGTRDTRWPNEPVIERGATLYLSGLAVSHFRHADLLGKIEAAGLIVIIGTSELDTARALREAETSGSDSERIINMVAASLAKAIGTGRVRLDARAPEEEGPIGALSLASLAARSPLLVYDDRFINRYEHFEHHGTNIAIATSYELIEQLARRGHLASERVLELRTCLRRGGAMFMPLTSDELLALLAEAAINDEGAVRETAELRAIRENIRLVQLRGWFERTTDTAWLLDLQKAIFDALAALWVPAVPEAAARARSHWLLGLGAIRDWAESAVQPPAPGLGAHGVIIDLLKLALIAQSVTDACRDAFGDWLEHEIMVPLWNDEPGAREQFLDQMRGFLLAAAPDLEDRPDAGPPLDERIRLRLLLESLPDFLRIALLDDESFADRAGMGLGFLIGIGEGTSFDQQEFLAAVRDLYVRKSKSIALADEDGRHWTLRTKGSDPAPAIEIRAGPVRRIMRGIPWLLPTVADRLAAFDRIAVDACLPPDAASPWRERIAANMLRDRDIAALEADLAASPGQVAEAIAASIQMGQASIAALVPSAPSYYERLAGRGVAESLEDYMAHILPRHLAEFEGDDPVVQARIVLLLASHPQMLAAPRFPELTPAQWTKLGAWVLEEGDLFARLGFAELALGRAKPRSALEKQLLALSAEIEALDPADKGGRLHYFASVLQLVDGELSLRGTLADWPPFQRRIAAIAQTALIERLSFGHVDGAHFAGFCVEQRGWRFFVQTLVDMRRDPRWRPDYATPQQWGHEILGRLLNRAWTVRDDGLSPALRAQIFPSDDVSARLPFPMAFWPGPTEGGLADEIQPPPDMMLELLDDALGEPQLTAKGLTLLINLEPMYNLPQGRLDRAIAMIVEQGPRLFSIVDADELQLHLVGLASLSASHRRPDLADHLQALARFQRNINGARPVAEDMQLALIAAASRKDADAWREFIGGWIRDIAWKIPVDEPERAEQLLGWLDTLASIDPAIRGVTGRSRAVVRLLLDQ